MAGFTGHAGRVRCGNPSGSEADAEEIVERGIPAGGGAHGEKEPACQS